MNTADGEQRRGHPARAARRQVPTHGWGRVNIGSGDGAAPWTLGDHRVWGHEPKGGGEGASGKEKQPRKKPMRAEEETDGDQTDQGLGWGGRRKLF